MCLQYIFMDYVSQTQAELSWCFDSRGRETIIIIVVYNINISTKMKSHIMQPAVRRQLLFSYTNSWHFFCPVVSCCRGCCCYCCCLLAAHSCCSDTPHIGREWEWQNKQIASLFVLCSFISLCVCVQMCSCGTYQKSLKLEEKQRGTCEEEKTTHRYQLCFSIASRYIYLYIYTCTLC